LRRATDIELSASLADVTIAEIARPARKHRRQPKRVERTSGQLAREV